MLEYLKKNPQKPEQLKAIQWARDILSSPHGYLILDTETTGLKKAEIVQVAVIDLLGNALLNTLIKPTMPIPRKTTAVHGIDDLMVANSPCFTQIYPQLKELLEDKLTLIYNSQFDCQIIKYCCELHQLEPIEIKPECVMMPYSNYIGEWSSYYGNIRWQKLPAGDHSALGDCLATLKVIQTMAETKI